MIVSWAKMKKKTINRKNINLIRQFSDFWRKYSKIGKILKRNKKKKNTTKT